MKVYAIAISFYLLGLLTFYTFGILEVWYWTPAYYLWDKTKDVLLLISISAAPRNAPGLKPVIAFGCLRLAWEILSVITGWNINNTKAVGILFMALIILLCLLLYKELLRWQRQNLR